MSGDRRPLIAVSSGDPAGIGPEIVLEAAIDPEVSARTRICVVGEKKALTAAGKVRGKEVSIETITDPSEGTYVPDSLTLIDTATLSEQVKWGRISSEGGHAAYAAVKEACSLAMAGKVSSVATAPIHKESLQAAGVPYIDHTSMFAGLTGTEDVMTMFTTHKLRIIFLTRHIALRKVPEALSVKSLVHGICNSARHLHSLGFRKPAVAIAALNPHGGEHGLFGTEEEEIIKPAIHKARSKVEAVLHGPVPADAVFHQAAQGGFDAVLSLYHDQGHIAAKTLDFRETVSFTLGLPFLRTSVDHGTAFDVAGRGKADAGGIKAAIKAASQNAATYSAPRKIKR